MISYSFCFFPANDESVLFYHAALAIHRVVGIHYLWNCHWFQLPNWAVHSSMRQTDGLLLCCFSEILQSLCSESQSTSSRQQTNWFVYPSRPVGRSYSIKDTRGPPDPVTLHKRQKLHERHNIYQKGKKNILFHSLCSASFLLLGRNCLWFFFFWGGGLECFIIRLNVAHCFQWLEKKKQKKAFKASFQKKEIRNCAITSVSHWQCPTLAVCWRLFKAMNPIMCHTMYVSLLFNQYQTFCGKKKIK